MHFALSRAACAILVSLSVSGVANAQATKFVTSPKGFEKTEGNTVFYLTASSSVNRRFVSIDATLMGSPIVVRSFGLRNDGSVRANTGTNSKLDFQLHMGTADFTTLDGDLDSNYSGKKTLVFKKTSVSFPDWSATPTSTPPPFNFVHTLDAPFLYLGKEALIWDMVLQNGASGNRPTDRQYGSRTAASGTNIGAGCTAIGRTSPFQQSLYMENSSSAMKNHGMRFRFYGTQAPANAPILASGNFVDANLTVPGWCAKVHALPAIPPVLLGTADTSGVAYYKYFQIPYTPVAVGVRFVTQLFTADTDGSLLLSNGAAGNMPSPTTATGQVEAAYCYTTITGTTIPNRATWFVGGTYVAMLGQ